MTLTSNTRMERCTATALRFGKKMTDEKRWSDGALSKLSVLTPFSSVCGPTSPPVYGNCDQLHATFPHGVGRPGAVDHTTGTPVSNYYVSAYIYNANTGLDRDKDGIACEKA